MKCPVEVYTPSTHPYRDLPELDYPFHDKTIHVTCCGRICLHRKNQSQHGLRWSSCRHQRSRRRYLAGQLYELRSWLRRSGGKNSATSRQSVRPKSVTYVAGTLYHVSGSDKIEVVGPPGFEPGTNGL